MFNQKERRLVLDLLETGKINSDDATQLLHALHGANTPEHRETVVFEIAADKDNLRQVVEKLNRAICR